jgi:hypothetical protein
MNSTYLGTLTPTNSPGKINMSYPVTAIKDIKADEAATLKAVGIRTIVRLLDAAKSPPGRRALAAKTGFDEKRLLTWAEAADRMRIKGMGGAYAALLRDVGVDTIKELKFRNPVSLARKIKELNSKRPLVRFLPPEKLVARWIEQAKRLPLVISYEDSASRAADNGFVIVHPQHHRSKNEKASVNTRKNQLTTLASQTFGDEEFARKWLKLPNPALSDQIPIEMAETNAGAREVEAILIRIAHGVYS